VSDDARNPDPPAPAQFEELLAEAGFDQLGTDPGPDAVMGVLRDFGSSLLGADELVREVARRAAIERLKALRVEAPAALVSAALSRLPRGGSRDRPQGRRLVRKAVEPWPEPVDGAQLLDELTALFGRYLALSPWYAVVLALWTVHTHAFDAADATPYLVLTSPMPRCGKTRVLEVLAAVVRRPLSVSSITSAALFRVIEAHAPTLLIDEADSVFRDNDELRCIINSGYKRASAFVARTVGDDHEPRQFSTWAPKAIAKIGHPPSTVRDRSIVLRMRRRTKRDPVERARRRLKAEADSLARRAVRWCEDRKAALAAEPEPLPGLNDRALEIWEPLLALADAASGPWPGRAREAALALSGDEADAEEDVRSLLLADLRDLFSRADADRLASAHVLDELRGMEDRPWADYSRQGISAPQLARLLGPFGIRPRMLRFGERTARGYRRDDFADAFERYLPADPEQAQHGRQEADFRSYLRAEHESCVTEADLRHDPHGRRHVSPVAPRPGRPEDNGRAGQQRTPVRGG